ncbi:GNAT family protein [Desulfosporosinus sp. PR]|uniref:GNAT family N-acetyltransferase n=1 Tax=Candidatus Desulfosporosinus nitrosoreducens TaxID=3401928 RepID=UPI0027F7C2B7|nr:GNAT family protein [Desulfosporosinus sp. PR]MDQ7096782.1 GNAT family protein [Desulfosporosinus sp. PR]
MYQLVRLEDSYFPVLYEWDRMEKNREHYTCRPLHPILSFESYVQSNLEKINGGIKEVFLLVEERSLPNPLGRIMTFDHNPRNHSKEFGYYIPPDLRGKGLGSIMVTLLLNMVFCAENELNKLYATTSSHNFPSFGLLEKIGFTLDGRLREHYWLEDEKFDQLHYSMLQREWNTISKGMAGIKQVKNEQDL